MSTRRNQRGVGFIEILVSVVIISIGFVAAAQMQVESMRASQGAYYRSQAYFLASEMVDRMRANVTGVRERRYDGRSTSADAENPDCANTACNPQQIADQDLFDWSAGLHTAADSGRPPLLPSVTDIDAGGQILRTGEGRYTIRLTWGEIIDNEATRMTLDIDFVAEL